LGNAVEYKSNATLALFKRCFLFPESKTKKTVSAEILAVERLQDPNAVNANNIILRYVTPCTLIDGNKYFGKIYTPICSVGNRDSKFR
jgi:hypothetical protein